MASYAYVRPSVGLLLVIALDLMVFIPRVGHAHRRKDTTVTLGIVVPHAIFMIRPYKMTIAATLNSLKNSNNPTYEFMKRYSPIEWKLVNMSHVPSPNEIFECLCETILPEEVPVIVFVSNTVKFDAEMAAAQYFLQLVDFLQIPVIAWNAENSGFNLKKTRDSVILQMAPSIRHQVAAMLDILREFNYHVFSAVTSHIAGHSGFVQAIRERMLELSDEYEFKMLGHEIMDTSDDADVDRSLSHLKLTETRIILLYSTELEAGVIFGGARQNGLIGPEYLWLVTQSVIGLIPNNYLLPQFPAGLIGVHFDVSDNGVLNTIIKGITIFANGLELFHKDPLNANQKTVIKPKLSCADNGTSGWHQGVQLYQYMKNVGFMLKPRTFDLAEIPVDFNEDGTLKRVTLDVVNLRDNREWQNVGMWMEGNLEIKGITWPSGDHKPPLGVPEKYHLRVTFLEEEPFVKMAPVDETTGKCHDKDVVCHIPPAKSGYDSTGVALPNRSYSKCCSGFTVDLLKMLGNDLGFTFEMNRVEDGLWGKELPNGTWNGLISELIDDKADIVATALKINEERERAVDFSVPLMETGISIIVRKRTGIISPQAFLEPFDTASWIIILVLCVQAAAISIFFFEWLSPDQIQQDTTDENFTLFRTFWLVWAMLFGAAVDVVCPRGLTARFVANIWATFAVIFNAIYTANLAAFMITREDFHRLEGVSDVKLTKAMMQPEPLKFGTIPFGNTEMVLGLEFPAMSNYMKNFSRPTVKAGLAAVEYGELDAFIYDAAVLDYLVGKDEGCRLLTVGRSYAKSGYAIAFQRSSEHLETFNNQLLSYRNYGELERLKDFWFAGACQQGKSASLDLAFSYTSLSVDQFISAFLLLGAGILLATTLLAAEKCYDAHLKSRLLKRIRSKDVLALLSQNLARSLTFEEAVDNAQLQNGQSKHKTCQNPLCDTMLWKARREMDIYRLKAEALEAELQLRPLDVPASKATSLEVLQEAADKPAVQITSEPANGIMHAQPSSDENSLREKSDNSVQPKPKVKYYVNEWYV